jgi:hypothetical protein
MDFRIDCPCGGHIVVTEGSAGATLACACGRPLSVPSLAALRLAAGLPAEVVGPEQIVGRLLAKGMLPGTKDCIGCGFESHQVFDVLTECETEYRTSSETPLWLKLIIGLLTLPFHFHVLFGRGEVHWHGRDTIFMLPVPICEQCRRRLRRRKRLKEGMRRIPEYGPLLDKYPWARVTLRKYPQPVDGFFAAR